MKYYKAKKLKVTDKLLSDTLMHLFAKNDKANVSTAELKKLKSLADILLGLSANDLARLIKLGELYEVDKYV